MNDMLLTLDFVIFIWRVLVFYFSRQIAQLDYAQLQRIHIPILLMNLIVISCKVKFHFQLASQLASLVSSWFLVAWVNHVLVSFQFPASLDNGFQQACNSLGHKYNCCKGYSWGIRFLYIYCHFLNFSYLSGCFYWRVTMPSIELDNLKLDNYLILYV